MSILRQPLPFPKQQPIEYLSLKNEPHFNASIHLQLEKPANVTTLSDLGYDSKTCAVMPSQLAITSAFRILSDEGVATVYDLCKQMESNKNIANATGGVRLGSFIRGAGYRSQFMHDLCASPELAQFLSGLTGVSVGVHSLPSIACGINYAPQDITKAIDTWHIDSMSFDIVMLMVDPSTLKGGEFQYFMGTKQEGSSILGISGEQGSIKELPSDRVVSVQFPAAGYGFLQHGNMVFHRACRLHEPAERITVVPSFVVLDPSKKDGTNIDSLMNWKDPGMLAELARHEAWIALNHLENLIEDIDLTAPPQQIGKALDESVASLNHFSDKLKQLNQTNH